MSSTFYISPFKPPVFVGETVLKILPEDYAVKLKKRWHDAKVTIFNPSSESESYVAMWSITDSNDFDLQGGLQKEQIVVSFKGNTKGLSAFVVWHRNYVSKDVPLFFFDSGLHINVQLSDAITENDVIILLQTT